MRAQLLKRFRYLGSIIHYNKGQQEEGRAELDSQLETNDIYSTGDEI